MWIVRLALRRPYTFIVLAILIVLVGVSTVQRMPADMFPQINIPVVAAIWQYTGLPPTEMEGRITTQFERAVTTTVSGIEHMESQTLAGASVVKVYMQPGTQMAGAVAQVAAVSQPVVRQMPPGTIPPLVMAYSASNVPVLQLGLSSDSLSEAKLNDLALNFVRPQLVTVPGAVVPYPYGGKQREVLINLDADGISRIRLAGTDAHHDLLLDEIFGDGSWGGWQPEGRSFTESCVQVLNLYKARLRQLANVRYVFSFEMRSRGNRLNYFLVFASQHPLGLEKMKEAMWSVDKAEGGKFSDFEPGAAEQATLFQFAALWHEMLDRFRGKKVPMADLERFVIEETDYLPKHARSVLKEREGTELGVEVVQVQKRRKGDFPVGKVVIVDNAWRFSSPYSLTLLSHMGGAIRRHSDSESAFSGRDAEFTININCGATDQELYEKDRTWVRQWFDALAPHSTGGAYVNFISEDGGERVGAGDGGLGVPGGAPGLDEAASPERDEREEGGRHRVVRAMARFDQ